MKDDEYTHEQSHAGIKQEADGHDFSSEEEEGYNRKHEESEGIKEEAKWCEANTQLSQPAAVHSNPESSWSARLVDGVRGNLRNKFVKSDFPDPIAVILAGFITSAQANQAPGQVAYPTVCVCVCVCFWTPPYWKASASSHKNCTKWVCVCLCV